MNVGENITRARKRKGLSQEELGNELGVTRQCVSLWETGQTVPSLDNLDSLSNILGVTISILAGQQPFPEDVVKQKSLIDEASEKQQRILMQRQKDSRTMSIAALICCIVQFFLFFIPGIGIISAGLGLFFSIYSYKQKKNNLALVCIVVSSVYIFAAIAAMRFGTDFRIWG